MPRVYNNDDNVLVIDDYISGSKCKLFFRTPTPAEHAKYSNSMYQRQGKKLVNRTGETRQEFGLEILTGFREGDYLKPGTPDSPHYDDKYKACRFSGDRNAPAFDPDWKKWVQKIAPDHIELLAVHAFENTGAVDDGPDLDDDQG